MQSAPLPDNRKRRSRAWDPQAMNNEVFETPDPEVTFHAYEAVRSTSGGGTGAAFAPEEAHVFDKTTSELDEDAMAPTQAFEAFMGKVYKPTPLLPKRTEFESTGGIATTSSSSSSSRSTVPKRQELESPLQRFTRLALEIKELESDLTLLAGQKEVTTSAVSSTTKVVVDAAQDAEFSEIMQGLATLQLNLSAMEQNAQFQTFLQPIGMGRNGAIAANQADAVAAMQRDLTTKFFHQIDALKQQQQPTTSSSSPSGGAVSSAPIVYEIFSNGELHTVDRDAKTRLLALESRIAMMEKLVGATTPKELSVDGLRGSGTGTGGASTDLSSLVDELDKRVGLLNEKNLDAIKTRTTALVHEFSLLHKLKESTGGAGGSGGGAIGGGPLNGQSDRDKIHQIYDKLLSVQETAASVPTLVDRLVTLKSVHDESLDLSGRVKKIEQTQANLQDLLESDASLLANIESSLQVNVEMFHANLQTLDDRMNHLLRSSSS